MGTFRLLYLMYWDFAAAATALVAKMFRFVDVLSLVKSKLPWIRSNNGWASTTSNQESKESLDSLKAEFASMLLKVTSKAKW